jgi:signal transduction histidine kinase
MSKSAKYANGADGDGNASLDRLAHELRTPLAAIQSMAEALAEGYLGPMENEQHAGYVRSIAGAAKHALAVVEAMLPSAAGMPGVEARLETLDVAALAQDVVAGMSLLAARAGVRLVTDTATGDPVCARACPTDVRQMLINLVSNGIVHAGGGSTVCVGVQPSRDGLVSVRVADDGRGIPREILDRLEAGGVLDLVVGAPAGSRLRLGLTLTRALADANGGRLEVKRGQIGTEACVMLPALSEPTAAECTEGNT